MSQVKKNIKIEDFSDDDDESVCDSTDCLSDDDDGRVYESTESLDSSDAEEVISRQPLGESQLTETVVEGVRQALDKLSLAVNNPIYISNSQNVHIGPKTTVTGNIIIQKKFGKGAVAKVRRPRQKGSAKDREERVECLDKNIFMKPQTMKLPKTDISIIPRWQWLARKPRGELDKIEEEPVELVVISHTATESATTPASNKLLIQAIQEFHTQSHGWADIAYNFMIGCDGNVYEGRGFGVVGAHTLGYNANSLGISFVGCFMNELPPKAALNACQNLLKKAVKSGHLSKDYKLIAHCQVRPTESPGRMLFERLQTWEHFHAVTQEETDNEETADITKDCPEQKKPSTT